MALQKTAGRKYMVSLALALSLAVPAAAATPAPASLPAAVSNITIDNFGKVNANYYRGASQRRRISPR